MTSISSQESAQGPWIARHWLLLFNLAVGLFVGGTLLPPALMSLGFESGARILYTLYGFTCHQLPQRSYFVFGSDGIQTFTMGQLLASGADPDHLRVFVGNPEIGFKLGMAQRNTAIYSALVLAGLGFGLLRRRIRVAPWQVFLLLIAPMALDGGSHLISEVTGLGFRATNTWLLRWLGDAVPAGFYSGTLIGSFNWLMRTMTGALFGIAIVWLVYPRVEAGMAPGETGGHSGQPVREESGT